MREQYRIHHAEHGGVGADAEGEGGEGDDAQLPSVVRAINDCHAVLVAKIGACPRDELKAAGIEGYAVEAIPRISRAQVMGWKKRW